MLECVCLDHAEGGSTLKHWSLTCQLEEKPESEATKYVSAECQCLLVEKIRGHAGGHVLCLVDILLASCDIQQLMLMQNI